MFKISLNKFQIENFKRFRWYFTQDHGNFWKYYSWAVSGGPLKTLILAVKDTKEPLIVSSFASRCFKRVTPNNLRQFITNRVTHMVTRNHLSARMTISTALKTDCKRLTTMDRIIICLKRSICQGKK